MGLEGVEEEKQLKIKTPSTGIFTEINVSNTWENSFWMIDGDQIDVWFVNIEELWQKAVILWEKWAEKFD